MFYLLVFFFRYFVFLCFPFQLFVFSIFCFRCLASSIIDNVIDILPVRYFASDILPLNIIPSIFCRSIFCHSILYDRILAFPIFFSFDILQLDILRFRYSAISIFWDLNILLSVFCAPYFAIRYFAFRYFVRNPCQALVQTHVVPTRESVRIPRNDSSETHFLQSHRYIHKWASIQL